MLFNNSAVAAKPCIKAKIACQNSSLHATLVRNAFIQSPAEQGKLQTTWKQKILISSKQLHVQCILATGLSFCKKKKKKIWKLRVL